MANKNKRFRLIIEILLSMLFISAPLILSAESQRNTIWNFSDPENYQYNQSYIDISGGLASLILQPAGIYYIGSQTFYDEPVLVNGTYTSPIYDSGGTETAWNSITWMSSFPAGKELPDNTTSSDEYTSFNGVSMADIVLLMHLNEQNGGTNFSESSPTILSPTCTGTGCPAMNDGGRFRNAAIFDGNDFIRLGSNMSLLNSVPAVTASVWVKPTSVSGEQQLINFSVNNAGGLNKSRFELRMFGDELIAGGRCPDSQTYQETLETNSVNLQTGRWYNIVAIVDYANKDISIYINGIMIAEMDGTAIFNCASGLTTNADSSYGAIGAEDTGDSDYFHGSIDEVAVWKRALDPQEIASLYGRGAGNVSFQVRSCDDRNCDDETWSQDYTGTSVDGDIPSGAPVVDLEGVSANRFFQYMVAVESDDPDYLPSLNSVTVSGSGGADANNSVSMIDGGINPEFINLSDFDISSSSGEIAFQLSNNGTNWYYYSNKTGVNSWTPSSDSLPGYNSAAEIKANIGSFAEDTGAGQIFFRFFLVSNGATPADLDRLSIDYTSPLNNDPVVTDPITDPVTDPVTDPITDPVTDPTTGGDDSTGGGDTETGDGDNQQRVTTYDRDKVIIDQDGDIIYKRVAHLEETGENHRVLEFEDGVLFYGENADDLSVAVDGNIIFVGASSRNNNQGAVYRIDRRVTDKIVKEWDLPEEVTKLNGESEEDRFGGGLYIMDFNGDSSNEIVVHAAGKHMIYIYDNGMVKLVSQVFGVPDQIFFVGKDYTGDSAGELTIGRKQTKKMNLSEIYPNLTEKLFVISGENDITKTINIEYDSTFTASSSSLLFSADAGDVNNDLINDLVLSSMDDCKLFIFHGSNSLAKSINTAAATVSIDGTNCDGDFGFNTKVGDVDGDGFADIVVSAESAGANAEGIITVISGAALVNGNISLSGGGDIYQSFTGSFAGGHLGEELGLKDMDGDGMLDIIASQIDGGKPTVTTFYVAGNNSDGGDTESSGGGDSRAGADGANGANGAGGCSCSMSGNAGHVDIASILISMLLIIGALSRRIFVSVRVKS